MDELRVKTETLPNRCEICHKSDQFDLLTRECLRCININTDKEILKLTDRIELHYNLTVNDHFRFSLNVLPKTFATRLIGIGAFLVITGMIYVSIDMIVSFPLNLIISMIVAIVWLLPFAGVWVLLLYLLAKGKGNKTRITDYKLIMGDKFLIEESKYKRDQYNWNAVQKISQNKKYIFIFDTEHSAILIPKRCFANKNEEIRFFELLNKFWKEDN